MSTRIEADAELIPGYTLIERIGQGGFGEVWTAKAPGGLIKAIKIVHGDMGANGDDDARKADQELRALRRIMGVRHPYLLSLERFDIVDGRLVIVMELAEGNLWDRFKECRAAGMPGIPRDELLRYMEQTSEVLDMMNDKHSLQHLDIKPQNIFRISGFAKVADFGLVKDLENMRAQVTGGVTPVYAAPETFDGYVTRYCDQYSLAIVYMELLTGERPFKTGSTQQLILAHIQGVPKLDVLPPHDQTVIARALAKKPEERYPSCMAMVRALQGGGAATPAPTSPGSTSVPQPALTAGLTANMTPARSTPSPPAPLHSTPGLSGFNNPSLTTSGFMPRTILRNPQQAIHGNQIMHTPATQQRLDKLADFERVVPRMAPPLKVGNGVIIPTVLVGLGQCGISVLLKVREALTERFDSPDRLPSLRYLAVDIDQTAINNATNPETPGALSQAETFIARLNRPGHYQAARRNGRSIIDGWFDPQQLFQIPRSQLTEGRRTIGRLAFCDHYNLLTKKLREQIEAACHDDSLSQTDRNTRLGLRTNRPRVYIISGLGGGTGSGCFLDMAYAARQKLRFLGYEQPEVFGIFVLPAAERANPRSGTAALSARVPELANTYAALTELHHFSLPDTVFEFQFDAADGNISDPEPPFRRVWLTQTAPSAPQPTPHASGLTGPRMSGVFQSPFAAQAQAQKQENKNVLDPVTRIAEFLRRELTSTQGKVADQQRDSLAPITSPPNRPVTVQSFGLTSHTWPRQTLLARTGRVLAEHLLNSWITQPEGEIEEQIKKWVLEKWEAQQLAPHVLVEKLQAVVQREIKVSPDQLFDLEAEPYRPKGWFGKGTTTAQLNDTLNKITKLLAYPAATKEKKDQQPGQIEALLEHARDMLYGEWRDEVTSFVRACVEMPEYRIRGALYTIKLLRSILEQALEHFEPLCQELFTKAQETYVALHQCANGGRKVPQAQQHEGLKMFPRWLYQAMQFRHVCQIYTSLISHLGDHERDMLFCKEKLAGQAKNMGTDCPPRADSTLLPAGCVSLDQAVQQQIDSLHMGDLVELDKRIQVQIETRFGSLTEIMSGPESMMSELTRLFTEQSRAYVGSRLGELNVVDMFFNRFGRGDQAGATISQAYELAAPDMNRMASQGAFCIIGAPDGAAGRPIFELAQKVLRNANPIQCKTSDEILIYREITALPMANLAQLGPVACESYIQAKANPTQYPHSRLDIVNWLDVDQG